MSSRLFFWVLIAGFFMLWTFRVLYLPAPESDTLWGFLQNTGLRVVFFLIPFLLAAFFLSKDSLRDIFALHKGTPIGWLLASFYAGALIIIEISQRAITPTTTVWMSLNFSLTPIIEELVFRGFIFTRLLKMTGKVQTVLISSVLFTLIHFPGWIFISGLKGENFLTITGQVFVFSLIQGVIRLFAKSVLPNIVVHIVNNFFAFTTE
jgi:membrane protease YdiL (CAAX protease family)